MEGKRRVKASVGECQRAREAGCACERGARGRLREKRSARTRARAREHRAGGHPVRNESAPRGVEQRIWNQTGLLLASGTRRAACQLRRTQLVASSNPIC